MPDINEDSEPSDINLPDAMRDGVYIMKPLV